MTDTTTTDEVTEEWLCAQTFDALMSEQEATRIGAIQQEGDAVHGVNFRVSLGVLTRSCDELMDNAHEQPEQIGEAWLDAMRCVNDSIDKRKREIELMQNALARMHVVAAQCCALIPDEEGSGGYTLGTL